MSKLANWHIRGRARRIGQFASLPVCSFLSGCLERTVTINSDPPGAVVWMNSTEVGRTPLTTGFTFYGDYDVRLRREGCEPLITHKALSAPIYEQAPIDLIATALPVRIKTHREWSFKLEPSPAATPESEAALVERARELRGTLAPAPK